MLVRRGGRPRATLRLPRSDPLKLCTQQLGMSQERSLAEFAASCVLPHGHEMPPVAGHMPSSASRRSTQHLQRKGRAFSTRVWGPACTNLSFLCCLDCDAEQAPGSFGLVMHDA